jgi:hypothetical protein
MAIDNPERSSMKFTTELLSSTLLPAAITLAKTKRPFS